MELQDGPKALWSLLHPRLWHMLFPLSGMLFPTLYLNDSSCKSVLYAASSRKPSPGLGPSSVLPQLLYFLVGFTLDCTNLLGKAVECRHAESREYIRHIP